MHGIDRLGPLALCSGHVGIRALYRKSPVIVKKSTEPARSLEK